MLRLPTPFHNFTSNFQYNGGCNDQLSVANSKSYITMYTLYTKMTGLVLNAAFGASLCLHYFDLPSVLWHCWLGIRKSIRPVKIEWWGIGVVICLEWGTDCLHMVHLMPLHPTAPSSLVSFKSRVVLPFWYRLTQVVLEKRPLNGCV